MKDCLDDLHYRRRQQCDLAVASLWAILLVALLSLIIGVREGLPPLTALMLLAIVFVLGVLCTMYVMSYRHRREHKQLHDMLMVLGAREQKAAPEA